MYFEVNKKDDSISQDFIEILYKITFSSIFRLKSLSLPSFHKVAFYRVDFQRVDFKLWLFLSVGYL
jgi:hypothetical protein